MEITNSVKDLVHEIESIGGKPLFVGGFVRDLIMKDVVSKDFDIEVFDVSLEHIQAHLTQRGFKVDGVGASFGILKVRLEGLEEPVDVSVPRTETKIGEGHRGFKVSVDPKLTFKIAAQRRDFTINAISMTPNGEIIDPFNGVDDIHNSILRVVNETSFKEDPLRVLRAAQFIARFNLKPDEKLVHLAKQVSLETIPKERVFSEFFKLATKGKVPGDGIRFLADTNHLHPALADLIGVPQDPRHHPEGDAFVHSILAGNFAAQKVKQTNTNTYTEEDKFVLVTASLLHDVGKVNTTKTEEDGRITSHGHAKSGVPIASKFLQDIGCFPRLIKRILPLIEEHMCHLCEPTPKNVRRLIHRLTPATLPELAFVCEADHASRGKASSFQSPLEYKGFLEIGRSVSENFAAQKSIVNGDDLQRELNIKPSKKLGTILNKLFEAQLDGTFTTKEEGIQLARTILITLD